ncbi:hypothetical protein GCM10022421_31040 [Oceanisphaera sediminis]|uniref:Uncharacterized protein n=1 Tax=Oceanisphaera sediminis TaxID=981381 RepID=A0ABP7EKH0_9GAMM
MHYFVATLIFLISFSASAEMPVEVIDSGSDSVGNRLIYKIKEKIRSSSSMGLTFDQTKLRMQARISTLDQNTQNPGYSTAYSMVITWSNPDTPLPYYLNHFTGYCGSTRVDSCASDVVAALSKQSDEIIRLLTNAK